MPTIPAPVGPRLTAEPLGNAYRQAPDVAANDRRLAAGFGEAARVLDRVEVDRAQTEAWQAQAKINESFLKFDAEARKANQGLNAAGYAARVGQWWDQTAKDYGQVLSPMAQQLVSKQLAQSRNQAIGSALDFERVEGKRAKLEALDGALSAEVSRGSQSPTAAVASAAIIADTLRANGASEGIPAAFVDKQVLQYQTALHTNVIKSLQISDPAAANAYFTAHKSEIDGARWDEITHSLNVANAGVDGDRTAGRIWSDAGIAPGKPVELDKLEEQARTAFPGDKARQDAALAGLRQRAQAFEHAERQRAAANTNTVWGAIDAGTPLGRVAAMPQWAALPEHEQHQIRLQIEQQAAVRESRAAAAESRAAAREQRILTGMKLQDELMFRGNADAYNQYSKPDVLAAMTVEQVGALRSFFGFDATQHLLAKREQLLTAAGRDAANVDAQDFNVFAQALGLRPDEPNKSEPQKDALATAQMRVETLIAQAAKTKGKPLDREEKQSIMRNELSRQVQVNPLFGFERARPIIGLMPDDIKNVVVPAADEARIAAWMARQYQADPRNPELAPSKVNLRLWYLREKSRSAQQLQAPQ